MVRPRYGPARQASGGAITQNSAEHGALAQSRPFGQHLAGRGQQVKPVAGGIGAFGVRRSPDDGLVHEFTLPAEYEAGYSPFMACSRAATHGGGRVDRRDWMAETCLSLGNTSRARSTSAAIRWTSMSAPAAPRARRILGASP